MSGERGADVFIHLSLSAEEAENGCTRTVAVDGRHESIKIPSGIAQSQVVWIPGLGAVAAIGGRRGNLAVTCEIIAGQTEQTMAAVPGTGAEQPQSCSEYSPMEAQVDSEWADVGDGSSEVAPDELINVRIVYDGVSGIVGGDITVAVDGVVIGKGTVSRGINLVVNLELGLHDVSVNTANGTAHYDLEISRHGEYEAYLAGGSVLNLFSDALSVELSSENMC